MMFDSLQEFSMIDNDFCFLMEDSSLNSTSFKVYIPKFMPLFSKNDKPKTTQIKIDNNIFLNAKDCKPQVSNTITIQNYITVKRLKNSWFRLHPSTIEKNTRFICKTLNGNNRDIFITDQDFNTDQTEKKKAVFIRNTSYEILDVIKVGDTVQVSYKSFYTIPLSTCDNTKEHFDEGHGLSDECKITTMNSASGTVSSKHSWGIVVNIGGKSRNITPENIIGVNKKPGEYSSYY